MKKYEWILFDADETLFHFNAFAGLKHMFAQYGVNFSKHDYHAYQMTNRGLWLSYQACKITAQQVQHRRFNYWAEKLQVAAADLNHAFLQTMAEVSTPIAGAENLLNSLKGKARLGIITNGFTQLQQKRLENTGLKEHFDLLVISEQVGFAKPQPEIFAHALALMGNPKPENILMVGDTLETDILGGNNAGFDTCWFNSNNRPVLEDIRPTYQIASLERLERLLLTVWQS